MEVWGKKVSLQKVQEDYAKLKSYRAAPEAERNYLDLYDMIKEIQDIIQSEYIPLLYDTQNINQDQMLLEVTQKVWSKYFIISGAIEKSQLPSHHFNEFDKDYLTIKDFHIKISALFNEAFNMNDDLRKICTEVMAGKEERIWYTKDTYFLMKILCDLEQANKDMNNLILCYQREVSLFNNDLIAFFTIFMQKEYIDILRIIQETQQSLADSTLQTMYAQAREEKKDTDLEKEIKNFVRADNLCKNLYSNLKKQIDQAISKEEKLGIADDIIKIQINPISQNPPPYNPDSMPQASKGSYSQVIKNLNLSHGNFKSTLLEAKYSVALQADENVNMNPYQRFLIHRALQLQAEFMECKEYYRKAKNDHSEYTKNDQLRSDNYYYKNQLWDLYKYFVPEISQFSATILPEKEVCLIVENDMKNDLDPTLIRVTHHDSKMVNLSVHAVDPEMKSDDIFALAIQLAEGYLKENTSKRPLHITGVNQELTNAIKAYVDAMKDLVKDKNDRTKYRRSSDDFSWSEKWAHSKLVSKMKDYIRKNGIEGLHGKVVYTNEPGLFPAKYEEKEGKSSQYNDINSKLNNTGSCCSIM